MVTSANQLAKSGKFGDLRRRVVFLLLALVVYRIGAHIPVPGIDPVALQQLFQGQSGGILNLFNMFSGGALSRFTVFALGIMPYISASIIMQLMTHVVPTLEALKKEGEAGRRKITQYTRYGTKGMCCGAGGARMWMEENVGTKVNDERAVEAISTGASRVATACPFCYIMLDDGVKAAGKEESEVKVADISIHLLDAIEAGERALANLPTPLEPS